ncbi:MAG: AAA family ATPase [Oscillospiraceae bacterium]|jgi:dephospho-CoA kinase|nr:AAA family ATPase [Oscillospiraceae bacterium]
MVIAAVGKNGTGKDFFLEYLAKTYALPLISIGDVVRELAVGDGLELTRDNLHKTSQKYMSAHGQTFFPSQICEKIKASGRPHYLVSGIRPPSDVQVLKDAFGTDFLLADVVISDDEVRYARMAARGSARDNVGTDEFRRLDAQEESIFRTSESEKMADVLLKNDGTAEDFFAAADAFYAKYIA